MKHFHNISFSINLSKNVGIETINVNILNMHHLLSKIETFIASGIGFCVATLNLDHTVKLRKNKLFYLSYRKQTLVTADGWPIVALGRFLGVKISRTTGSDMVKPVIELLLKLGKSVAIVGSEKAALGEAVDVLRARYPALRVSYTNAPPFGFDPLSDDAERILHEVVQSGAAVCLVALGAPKQEIFAARAMKITPEVGYISVGAAIDFLANRQVRAPRRIQQLGLEWLWRLVRNPRRLFWRYFKCACIFPVLLSRALTQRLSKNVQSRPQLENNH
jgi:N-acetylglucosaminyldiphosphoundecaprenol N-acetyl-beta-D-mannosaminyltransferase